MIGSKDIRWHFSTRFWIFPLYYSVALNFYFITDWNWSLMIGLNSEVPQTLFSKNFLFLPTVNALRQLRMNLMQNKIQNKLFDLHRDVDFHAGLCRRLNSHSKSWSSGTGVIGGAPGHEPRKKHRLQNVFPSEHLLFLWHGNILVQLSNKSQSTKLIKHKISRWPRIVDSNWT